MPCPLSETRTYTYFAWFTPGAREWTRPAKTDEHQKANIRNDKCFLRMRLRPREALQRQGSRGATTDFVCAPFVYSVDGDDGGHKGTLAETQ